ncbi:class I SAM-dependent methyltransferase [Mycobacterium lepromatosis]|uniref:class I SAM-dependent methyltransferase n=1 Tax=Mycobacterium lepromatosis TaxID=480418 RepID=UPI000A9440D4|nr:class I SAM-dependent methyltransferase [Mycobacterium lepromatosis]
MILLGAGVYAIGPSRAVEYERGILQSHGAMPTVQSSPVPVDLLDAWPAALAAAVFYYSQPTALLAEGLLPYLSGDTVDRLFEIVTTLSALGSRVASDPFGLNSSANPQRWSRMRDRLGLNVNVPELAYHKPD